jgi:hypothetical protein
VTVRKESKEEMIATVIKFPCYSSHELDDACQQHPAEGENKVVASGVEVQNDPFTALCFSIIFLCVLHFTGFF